MSINLKTLTASVSDAALAKAREARIVRAIMVLESHDDGTAQALAEGASKISHATKLAAIARGDTRQLAIAALADRIAIYQAARTVGHNVNGSVMAPPVVDGKIKSPPEMVASAGDSEETEATA